MPRRVYVQIVIVMNVEDDFQVFRERIVDDLVGAVQQVVFDLVAAPGAGMTGRRIVSKPAALIRSMSSRRIV